MPITALTQSVVRALGSSQVLTTPVSLVKELVENALDARASSIVVEISSNTLDCIQVKDNGHGIAPEDRENVAKRHFTSKIRDMAELRELGGRYLGFRGEALASAAELAASLELATRIEGERAACKMIIGRAGQVLRKESASHPVGTTVQVTKFLQNIPVRKEVALKNALGTLNEVKQLLQKYALARPTVRLSLKVLKAKNDKYNWIYAPPKNATVADAALSIFGTVMSQTEVDISSSNENTFRFEALLPKSNAEPTLINNKGHFVSIDSRPVSCTKGTMKQALTLYKDYIRSALSDSAASKIKDPVICMNIICPPASYDPNVEAAKDDVLFENQSLLIYSLGAFFSRIYGPLRKADSHIDTRKTKGARKTNAFELLLARKRSEADTIKQLPQGADSHRSVKVVPFEDVGDQMNLTGGRALEAPLNNASVVKPIPNPGCEQESDEGLFFEEHRDVNQQPRWRSTMYDIDDDGFDEPAPNHAIEENANKQKTNYATEKLNNASEKKMQSTGPQMNSPPQSSISKPVLTIHRTPDSNRLPSRPSLLTSSGESAERSGISPSARSQAITFLPTPSSTENRVSPHASSSPQGRVLDRARNTSEDHSSGNQGSDLTIRFEHDSLSDANLSSGRTFQANRVAPAHAEVSGNHHADGFVTARSLPLNGVSDPGPSMQRPVQTVRNSRWRNGNIQVEPIASVKGMNRTLFDIGGKGKSSVHRKGQNMEIREALALSSSNQSKNRNIGPSEPIHVSKSSSSTISVLPDIEELLDYERRKKIANERSREKLSRRGGITGFLTLQHDGSREQLTAPNSPHRNRYNAAIAALHYPAQTNDVDSTCTLSSGDPRGYFIRMISSNNRGGQGNGSRPRASMLPLEAVPEGFRLQILSTKLQSTLAWVEEHLQQARLFDPYVREGVLSTKVFTTDERTLELEKRLKALVNTQYRQDSGESPNLNLDLQRSFRDNVIVHS